MARKDFKTRPLTEDDLQHVIDIDASYVGRRREGFYRKRLKAAINEPRNFIYIGCEKDGSLQGYLLARLQEGEYGTEGRCASMDAIGVDTAASGNGMGRGLLQALDEILKHKGIETVYTQAEWFNLSMLGFFARTGFSLAPRYILERDAGNFDDSDFVEELVEEAGRPGDPNDYSNAESDQRGALARDIIPCRVMMHPDLPAIVRIDSNITGKNRQAYYRQKFSEVFDQSGIRVSLVAEQDDHVVGFLMARVDFGEFDRIEPAAVLDSIGVDPGYTHHLVGTAMLSQLLTNLGSLGIEVIRSEADAEHLDVLQFLQKNGFSNSQRLSFVRDVS